MISDRAWVEHRNTLACYKCVKVFNDSIRGIHQPNLPPEKWRHPCSRCLDTVLEPLPFVELNIES
jgi:hypothetical protein